MLQEVLAPLLRRKCERRTLAEVDEEALPLFVKPVSNDKAFDGARSTPLTNPLSRDSRLTVRGLLAGRVVSTAEDLAHLLSEAGGSPADCAVWVSEPVEFVAEHRLFVGGGKVYGVGRIRGEEQQEGPPQEFVDEVLGCAAHAPPALHSGTGSAKA